jgi:hypothetical protein
MRLFRILAVGISLCIFGGLVYAPTVGDQKELEIPIYEGGQVIWELYLSKEFLGWIKDDLKLTLRRITLHPSQQIFIPGIAILPDLDIHDIAEVLKLRLYRIIIPDLEGRVAELIAEALAGLEEVRVLGYTIDVDPDAILDFYDQKFPKAQGWQRNLWIRQKAVLYSLSEEGRLREVAAFLIFPDNEIIAARTKGFLSLRALVELVILWRRFIDP